MVQIARECSNCVHGDEHPYADEFLFCKIQEARVAPEDYCNNFEARFKITEVVEDNTLQQYEPEVPSMYEGDPAWNEDNEHNDENDDNDNEDE